MKFETMKLLPVKKDRYVSICRTIIVLFVCLVLNNREVSARTSIAAFVDQIKSEKENSRLVALYDSIYSYYEYSNSDSGIYYLKQGLIHFSEEEYNPGKASILARLADIYSHRGMQQVARNFALESLKIYNEIGDSVGVASTDKVMGLIEAKSDNLPEACGFLLDALKIYSNLKDSLGIASIYVDLGSANAKAQDGDKALEYYMKGLNYYNHRDGKDIFIVLNNNIGYVYAEKGDTADALKYYHIALDESNQERYEQIRLLPYQNLGKLYATVIKDTAKAVKYANMALDIAKKNRMLEERTDLLLQLSGYLGSKEISVRLNLLDTALNISETYGLQQTQAEILKNIIAIYKAQKDYKNTSLFQAKLIDLSDSLLASEKRKANSNLEAKHQLDELNEKIDVEETNEKQQQEKSSAIFKEVIFIAIGINLVLFVLIYFYQKTKKLNKELKSRELSLEQSNNVKNKMISIIAHDLLGSIGFMPLSIGLCKDTTLPQDERYELLSQVELNAIAAHDTLQNMLDWAKSQIRGITLKQVEFNVNGILSDVLEFIRIRATNKNITIVNNISGDLSVLADPHHFRFIIRNLLSNAVKYTKREGIIELSAVADRQRGLVTFLVQDNGVGIAADRIGKLFDADVEGTVGTDNELSNGLGLNLCKEFLTINGGEIWVNSREGAGTEFYFTLKMSPAQMQATE